MLRVKDKLELKKRIVKTLIWSTVLYVAETWTLRKVDTPRSLRSTLSLLSFTPSVEFWGSYAADPLFRIVTIRPAIIVYGRP